MSAVAEQIASYLLEIEAVRLSPIDLFTWASGWKAPIYCDNRKTLSHPKVRTYIKEQFVATIREKYPETEVIAGVATGAIAQGALVAEALDLPFIYIRSSAKDHGLTNLIEGEYKAGQKVVVIEDLISTGGSSLKAVEALRASGCEVLGMVAIFSYGFAKAEENFKASGCELSTLSNYDALIDMAEKINYVKTEQVEKLKEWRLSPETFK